MGNKHISSKHVLRVEYWPLARLIHAHAVFATANLFFVDNPPGLSVAEAIGRYKNNGNVEYVEPDYNVSAVVFPSDPQLANQWDMTNMSATSVWPSPPNTSGVVVAIIDTGVDYTHPDLQGNLWTDASSNHGFTCMAERAYPGAWTTSGTELMSPEPSAR